MAPLQPLSDNKLNLPVQYQSTASVASTMTEDSEQAESTGPSLPDSNCEQVQTPMKDSNSKKEKNLYGWICILYFFYYASTGSLIPYLPVYYRSLGYSGQVIGLLSSLRSLVSFLVGPLWAMLADGQGSNRDTTVSSSKETQLSILHLAVVGSILGFLCVGWVGFKCQANPTLLMLAVIVTSIFYSPVKSLMDSMVLKKLSKNQQAFGKLRLWGPIGFGLGCSLSGAITTHTTANLAASKLKQTGYTVPFAIFAILSLPLLGTLFLFPKGQPEQEQKQPICVSNKDLDKDKPDKTNNSFEWIFALTKDTWVFFFLVLGIGINYGAVETFCYVRMREVGASGQQIGFSRFLSAMAGTPMFWFSNRLANHMAEHAILVLCLMAFATRCMVYALARSPLDALPAEAIRGVAFAAFCSTASTYAHQHSPPGFSSTMLMVVNSLYGGMGQSIGSTLAGFIQHQIGTVQMFLVILCWDFALIAMIGIFWIGSRSSWNQKNLEEAHKKTK